MLRQFGSMIGWTRNADIHSIVDEIMSCMILISRLERIMFTKTPLQKTQSILSFIWFRSRLEFVENMHESSEIIRKKIEINWFWAFGLYLMPVPKCRIMISLKKHLNDLIAEQGFGGVARGWLLKKNWLVIYLKSARKNRKNE